jgi:hypothetical protein
MAATLSDEHIERVEKFFESDAAEALWTQLEAGVIADWINATEAVDREDLWRRLQVILQLKIFLRDSAAMKRLSERAQERRVFQT